MRNFLTFLLGFCLCCGGLFAVEKPGTIDSSNVRKQEIERAQALTKPGAVTTLPADFVDPFASTASNLPGRTNAVAGQKFAPANDRDLLMALVAKIVPTGVIYRNDIPILLIHEKKLKTGDPLSVNLDGTDYSVTVAAIQRGSFTLRYNQEEITRPIK